VRDLGVALGDMERRLEALQLAADREKDSRVAGRARTAAVEMRKIENQWDALQKELSSKYGNSHHGLTSIEGIASQLDGNSAIVGWHESSSTGLAWGYVLRAKGGVTWIQLENSDPAAGNRTKAFREEMHRVSSWPMRVTETEKADKAGADLWSFFVEPLLPELANVENLIVIPSGSLLGIPIEALQSPTGEYLSDRFAVSYSPSATVYALLASRKNDSSVDPGTALLVGDPPFRASHVEDMRQSDLAASAADVDAITDEGLVGQAVLRGALGGNQGALSKLPRLPRSRDEIIEIAKAFEKPTVLLGPDAAEQKLSDLASQNALASYQTIHLATHALVDEEAPERSALVLSRVELPDPMDALVKGDRIYDGMVTISEISREWNLSADLVTLSGCQTALGRESGGEGYIGFAQAFLQAGAQSLLVSLWKVDDLATAKLMSRFYQNLAEGERGAMTKQKALQEAKSWLRNYEDTSGAKPFQHPAYWAGFVLMGNAN
ncbi:MAG: CHAT domain-containing protein, partial [Candidatus Eisenbacteria bacterium]|nr:CHAT domain-containing protein [Candidatus Eisenbacteria bacterium]